MVWCGGGEAGVMQIRLLAPRLTSKLPSPSIHNGGGKNHLGIRACVQSDLSRAGAQGMHENITSFIIRSCKRKARFPQDRFPF